MRVVKTEDLETVGSSAPARVEMILRIDQEPVRVVGQVARRYGFDDFVAAAQKNAAALGRRGFPGMRDNRLKNVGSCSPILDS